MEGNKGIAVNINSWKEYRACVFPSASFLPNASCLQCLAEVLRDEIVGQHDAIHLLNVQFWKENSCCALLFTCH